MLPCHNMKDEGYHDSCSVSAIASVTGVPFKEVADYMMADFGVPSTDGGFPIRVIDHTLKHFGFPCESARADYFTYLTGQDGWPKNLTRVVKDIGVGKAVVDVIMIPGNPETCHSLAVENGLVADIIVSETPVPLVEWLRLYHADPHTKKVWGDPDVIGITHLTQNPIPKPRIEKEAESVRPET